MRDAYIRQLFAAEDAHLQRIQRETRQANIRAVSINPEEGHTLAFLLRAIGARRVIEVGTLAGYSATWIARALPADGQLITLEADSEHAALARRLLDAGGLSERVTVTEGDALTVINTLRGPFDALFIDADKPHLMDYLEWGIDNLRTGGLITAHNAFMRGRVFEEDEAAPVREMMAFTQRIAEDPRLHGTIIPIGDGFVAALVNR